MVTKLIEQYKGLPKQVYIILTARTIAAMGAFVFPVVTMFLSSRLHFSDQVISYYLLALSLSYMIAAALGGKLADKFNRKNVYVAILLCSNILLITAGFFTNSIIIIPFMFFGTLFMNMANPVMAAMLTDVTTPETRQESMSLCYLGYNLGLAVGPLIAGFLFENHTPWIFWGQGIINTVAVLIIIVGLKDVEITQAQLDEIKADERRHQELASDKSFLRELLNRPVVIAFACIAVIYAFSYSQISYMMALHLEDIFGIAKSSKYIGIIWSINGICVFAFTPIVVYAFKRFDSLFNISLAGLGYAIGFGMYAFTNNIVFIFLLVIVWSAGEVLSSANCGVFIANNSPASHRARFQSIYDVVQGIGRASGPLLMGIYLMNHTIPQAWFLIGILCLCAFIAFFILHKLHSHIAF